MKKHFSLIFIALFLIAGGMKAQQTPVANLQSIDPLALSLIDDYVDCYIAVINSSLQKPVTPRVFDFTTITGNKMDAVELTQTNRFEEGLIFRVTFKKEENGKKYFLFQQKSTGNILAENVVNKPYSEYDTGGKPYWDLKVEYDATGEAYAIGHPTETTWAANRNCYSYDWATEKMGYKASAVGDDENEFVTDDYLFYFLQYEAPVDPIIKLSTKGVSFDQNVRQVAFTIEAINITGGLEIDAADEIGLSDWQLNADATGAVNVTVIADYQNNVDYTGTLTVWEQGNHAIAVSIPVKYRRDTFTPTSNNMVPGGGYMNSFDGFDSGWGTKMIVSAADEDVYSGANCAKIAGKSPGYPNGGSIDVPIEWEPGTYRIRAMVKAVDGAFIIGVQKTNIASPNTDINFTIEQTGDNWVQFDKKFIVTNTASALMFFNTPSGGGITGYIDNWELYKETEATIELSTSALAFDNNQTDASFTVIGANIVGNISITTDIPNLITLFENSLPADVSGNVASTEVWVSYTGSEPAEGTITVSNGSETQTIAVKIVHDDFVPHELNINQDPYMNSLGGFGGWGKKSLASVVTDDVFSGAYCGKIAGTTTSYPNGGSIDFNTIGEYLEAETTYRVRARIKTVDGSFILGISGLNGLGGDEANKDYLIPQSGDEWVQFDGCFTTDFDFQTNANMYFNNDGAKGATGKLAYIDNWEVYPDPTAVDPNGLSKINIADASAYSNGKSITVKSSEQIQQVYAYNLQGALIYASGKINAASYTFEAGNAGIYIVKLITYSGNVKNLKVLVK
ncbi:MAG: hypothetical protein EZS26_000926 [Candidatus Ordinivivax streblomastigis]|uniref:Uncharacterized protein n=1 Tax=Candidatus Ordinivivax streblomastigis TaxID=2540710 RepID=A0A5M8P355_9BACT|nr:MAG: hypothetical protein EZS26_000926 [Candidatus Ordinivivax streblomastigis]